MRPGDLVKFMVARIGTPKGAIGLVLKVHPGGNDVDDMIDVQICNAQQRTVRRLERDIEVINASR